MEKIIVLDFGGQYNQLIARRVRECSVYCEVKPYNTPISELKELAPIGLILTGGPNSVYDEASPHVDRQIFELGIPVLGICYGCQLMAYTLDGSVLPAGDAAARIMERRTLNLTLGMRCSPVCPSPASLG